MVACMVVIAGLLLPALVRPARRSPRIKCVNNLKNVGLAFRIFAADNQGRFPVQVSSKEGGALEWEKTGAAWRQFIVLSNELSTPKILLCPMDKKRKAAEEFGLLRDAHISYFVGLDARETLPASFLSGDRHLTVDGRPVPRGIVNLATNSVAGWTAEIHQGGHVAMGDGSVQQFSSARLNPALRMTGFATNRLVVP